MKFPLEVNHWSLHCGKAPYFSSKDRGIKSSRANGSDRPALVPPQLSSLFMSDRKMKQEIDRWFQPVSDLMSDDVTRYTGEEMSWKVRLSINQCVSPTLICGHKRSTVTWGTRLTTQVAKNKVSMVGGFRNGQGSEFRVGILPFTSRRRWLEWFW